MWCSQKMALPRQRPLNINKNWLSPMTKNGLISAIAAAGGKALQQMMLKIGAGSSAGDEERRQPVLYIIRNHVDGAIFRIEPGPLLGEALLRSGNVEGRPSKRR